MAQEDARRPNPLTRLLRFLVTTPTGRFALGALALLLAAVVARAYWVEHTRPAEEVRRQDVGALLDAAQEALKTWSDGRAEGAPPFPDNTPWTPAALECGREAAVSPGEAAHPTWTALQVRFEGPARYQVRFSSDPKTLTWELLARTDADCDGVYEVFRRSGGLGIAGLTTRPPQVDNPGE